MQNEQQPGLPGNEQDELQQKVDKTLNPTDEDSVPPKVSQEPQPDNETDDIVADIVAREGDELLEAHDEKLDEAFDNKEPSWPQKLKDFFINWWQNPAARWSTIAGLVLVLIVLVAVPPSRYFLINSVGIRSRASLNILDDSTQQPLKNVQVSLGGQNTLTDKDGIAALTHVKLGSSQLTVEKRGFVTLKKKVVVGWGSNPLGSQALTPQGSQYVLSVADFLSNKPISKVEATSGDASALSDDKGIIKITIDKPGDEVGVSVKGDGYREEKLKFNSGIKDTQNVKLVPSHQHIFVSKRSGKYDVYKIDADGGNEQVVLSGTGAERDDITLVPHPTKSLVALVSTRDNQHNSDGFLLSTLTLINTSDNNTIKIVQSERVQVIGWVGGKLVYVEIAAGSSAANPKRNRIMSYDYDTKIAKELANANYFNDMQIIGGKLYYAPASVYQSAGSAGLYKIDVDGTNKQIIVQEETWNIFRTSYGHLVLSLQNQWDDYQISDGKISKLNSAPASPSNRVYTDSPDGKHVVWVDNRDGKGVLLSYDTTTDKVKRLNHKTA